MGARHAQSLLSLKKDYKIYVIEPSIESFENGLSTIGCSRDALKLVRNLNEINCTIDIAISATCSQPRYKIIKDLIHSGIKYFLLEKIVFQSIDQFDTIIKLLEDNKAKAYCNYPRRYYSNYFGIKKLIDEKGAQLDMNVIGGNNGLGCNAIHFIDLFEYITNSQISDCTYELSEDNEKNKRGKEYKDVNGLMIIKNKRNDYLSIYFDPTYRSGISELFHINGRKYIFSARDKKEYQFNNNKILSNKYVVLQTSELTSIIVEDIIKQKTKLPTLQDTRNAHMHLFEMIMSGLNLQFTNKSLCPIT